MTAPQSSTGNRVWKSESLATRKVSQKVLDVSEMLTEVVYNALAEAGTDWIADCSPPSGSPRRAVGGFIPKTAAELRMFELGLCGPLRVDAESDDPVDDLVEAVFSYAEELRLVGVAMRERQVA